MYNHFFKEKQFLKQWEPIKAAFLQSGMPQDLIEETYKFLRMQFNSDRRFYEHNDLVPDFEPIPDPDSERVPEKRYRGMEILSDITDKDLHIFFEGVDDVTLEILTLKMDYYTYAEIADYMNAHNKEDKRSRMTAESARKRVDRLRRRLQLQLTLLNKFTEYFSED